ncbi:MAG: VTT domain-containing protein [Oligoflexia bacterium]|nr:VTT domain-containing protein [Oligoflexia bacterium]
MTPTTTPVIDRFLAGLTEWQIYAVAIGLLLQGVVVAVAPEEVVLMSLGVLWSQNRIHFLRGLTAAALGLLSANLIIVFVAGRFSHLSIFRKPAVHKRLEKFRKRGKWIVFLTRFTPFIRGPVYYAAGISGMSPAQFFKIDALAFCIHGPLIFLIGAAIGLHTGSITEAYKYIAIGALSVAVAIAAGTWLSPRFSKAKKPTPATSSDP